MSFAFSPTTSLQIFTKLSNSFNDIGLQAVLNKSSSVVIPENREFHFVPQLFIHQSYHSINFSPV